MKHLLSRLLIPLLAFLALAQLAGAAGYQKIIIPEKGHPALRSAAGIIAKKLGMPEATIQTAAAPGMPGTGEIVLATLPEAPAGVAEVREAAKGLKHDGYVLAAQRGGVLICGARPRSLLFAAGDVNQWKDKAEGTLARDPAFATRTAIMHGRMPVAELVATLGINLMIGERDMAVTFKETLPEVYAQLTPADRERLGRQEASVRAKAARVAQECRDADIEVYPFLYGNNMQLWSPALYEAAIKAYPSAKGTPAPQSWEKATLCPSDPNTWKIIDAYVKEFAEQTQGSGIYVTFWDTYGINCQCERCVKSGLSKFPNQLYEICKHYQSDMAGMGKKLVVRTWSSGVAHWLGDQWVHAPGYDHFSGSGAELWGRVFKEVDPNMVIQTKVYHADCQPDPRFSPLLGQARPHSEIAEWQITGQTTGRFFFPASTVDHTAWTMKKAQEMLGPEGGVSLYWGATKQAGFNLLNDIANSINVYAWRELSWNPGADVEKIWLDWATPIYGAQAAPHVVKALRMSEDVVNHSFSTLGMGSDTNSGFAGDIARRETLLKYTNRYFLPEGVKALEPTKENIQRVIEEKEDVLKKIGEMQREIEAARPMMKKEQADELATRVGWLKEFSTVARYLDESLWRYRYVRYLAAMLTTDPEQLKSLAAAYDAVEKHRRLLFQFDPKQTLSCYGVPLGELMARPSLGNPMALMTEIYQQSRGYVESTVGPDGYPKEWQRGGETGLKITAGTPPAARKSAGTGNKARRR